MTYVTRIVQTFGGVRPMAAALEQPVSTVAAWKARGSIPDAHKPRILRRAREMGLALEPQDFFPGDAAPQPPTPDGEAA